MDVSDKEVESGGVKTLSHKILLFTCYGGCETGVAASKAVIRIWEENPYDVKIGCLPAVIVPWKLKEIMRWKKRILIDACGVRCGAKLAEREGMTVDRYIELTSTLGIRKVKRLPAKGLEDEVYRTIRKEVDALLGRGEGEKKRVSESARSKGLTEMTLRPVGVVRNRINEPSLVAESGDLEWRATVEKAKKEQGTISELVIDGHLKGILDGIEGFSHLLVLYWAHHVSPEGHFLIKAHPIGRKDVPLAGIFAACNPARPNPICATMVRLVERKANVLKVEGLDAIDGSPLVDIKPYILSYYSAANVRMTDWMLKIEREFAGGSFSSTPGE